MPGLVGEVGEVGVVVDGSEGSVPGVVVSCGSSIELVIVKM